MKEVEYEDLLLRDGYRLPLASAPAVPAYLYASPFLYLRRRVPASGDCSHASGHLTGNEAALAISRDIRPGHPFWSGLARPASSAYPAREAPPGRWRRRILGRCRRDTGCGNVAFRRVEGQASERHGAGCVRPLLL